MTALSVHRRLGWARTLLTGVLAGGAALLLSGMLAAAGSSELGYDFRATYAGAAELVIGGDSPYPDADDGTLERERGYVYPPVLAFVLAPLTTLPIDVAAMLAVLAAGAALAGTLAVLGVRDLRCYAALFLSAPAWNALEMANVSAALALALALVWRYRDEAPRAGVALGLAVATKLLLWPLLVWAAATRRLGVAAWAFTTGLAAVVLSWAAIGFAGLGEYPDLLRRLSEIQAERSYSLVGVADALGLDERAGTVAALGLGLAFLAWSFLRARGGDDLGAFTLAIAAALALTPVLWQHYLVLLFVPLAVSRPRFHWVWLLPLVVWLSPRAGNGEGIETVLPMLVMGVVIALGVGGRSRSIVAGAHERPA